MAKLHKNRLKLEHDFSGKEYKTALHKIILKRKREVMEQMVRLHNESIKAYNRAVPETDYINMPTIEDVLPSETEMLKQTIADTKLINADIRERLVSRLKDVVKKPEYYKQRGKLTGTLKDDMIKDFTKEVNDIFKPFVRVDPEYGVPANVKRIATTQLRTSTNTMKDDYFDVLMESNPDIGIGKKWIHNARLSKNPRPHHMALGRGKAIPYSEMFVIHPPKGKPIKTPHPHWTGLPAGEVINCNCEVQYLVNKKRKSVYKADQEEMVMQALGSILQKAWQRKDGSWWEHDPETGKIVPYKKREKKPKEEEEKPADDLIKDPNKFEQKRMYSDDKGNLYVKIDGVWAIKTEGRDTFTKKFEWNDSDIIGSKVREAPKAEGIFERGVTYKDTQGIYWRIKSNGVWEFRGAETGNWKESQFHSDYKFIEDLMSGKGLEKTTESPEETTPPRSSAREEKPTGEVTLEVGKTYVGQDGTLWRKRENGEWTYYDPEEGTWTPTELSTEYGYSDQQMMEHLNLREATGGQEESSRRASSRRVKFERGTVYVDSDGDHWKKNSSGRWMRRGKGESLFSLTSWNDRTDSDEKMKETFGIKEKGDEQLKLPFPEKKGKKKKETEETVVKYKSLGNKQMDKIKKDGMALAKKRLKKPRKPEIYGDAEYDGAGIDEKKIEEYLGLTPDDHRMSIGSDDGQTRVEMHPLGAKGKVEYTIRPEDFHIDYCVLDKKHHKKSSGTFMFNNVLSFCQEHGIDQVSLQAAGYKGSELFNGYYSWLALGFDTPLRDRYGSNLKYEFREFFEQAGLNYKKFKTLREAVSSLGKKGFDLWKEYGQGWDGTFDVTDKKRVGQFYEYLKGKIEKYGRKQTKGKAKSKVKARKKTR